jgi:hypothetical protein
MMIRTVSRVMTTVAMAKAREIHHSQYTVDHDGNGRSTRPSKKLDLHRRANGDDEYEQKACHDSWQDER